jgi:hypothetical protein
VGVHPLPRRTETNVRVAGGVSEPPCYGSVWPVVWGAGVKISRLPDSAFPDLERARTAAGNLD